MQRLLLTAVFIAIAALVASEEAFVNTDLGVKDVIVPEEAMPQDIPADFLQASENLFQHSSFKGKPKGKVGFQITHSSFKGKPKGKVGFQMKNEPKVAQKILKALEKDKDEKHIKADLELMKKYALKIKNPVARKKTLDAIARMAEEKEEENDLKHQVKAAKQDAKETDKENNHVKYPKNKKHKEELLQSTELFQYEYDEENTDPEYLAWKGLHQEWKAFIQEHGIDTSKARTRSPEEHNELVTRYIADTFMSIDSTATLGTGATLAGKCLHGALQVIAPKFCWKGGHHNHQIPSKCPAGWRRNMAECFQNCRSGYYFVGGGTCWAYCRRGEEELEQIEAVESDESEVESDSSRKLLGSGRRRRRQPYSDHGATCYRGIFDWYAKHHYWPSRITNFDGRVPCNHNDQYKSGAMCYRRCDMIPNGKTKMVNCGYDACSTDGSTCASTIINMIMEIGFSIASIAALVGTAGAAAPATAAGGALVRKSGAQAAKTVSKAAARSAMKESGKSFAKKAGEKLGKITFKSVAQQVGMGWTENAVKNFCNEYAKAYHSRLTGNVNKFDPKSLDFSGTAAAVDACGSGKANSQPWTCAGAITGVLSVVDPTGLLGVASAFMHDNCNSK